MGKLEKAYVLMKVTKAYAPKPEIACADECGRMKKKLLCKLESHCDGSIYADQHGTLRQVYVLACKLLLLLTGTG